jgi:hypothetical protein
VRERVPLPDAGGCRGDELSSEQLFESAQWDAAGSVLAPFHLHLLERHLTPSISFRWFYCALAVALNLLDVEENPSPKSYAPLVQAFTRFVLDLMSTEANTYLSNPVLLPTLAAPASSSSSRPSPSSSSSSQGSPSVVSQVLGMDLKHTVTCLACGSRSSRASTVHTVDLVYPRKVRSPASSAFPLLISPYLSPD